MLSEIFTVLLGLAPQSERVADLLHRIKTAADRDELLYLLCSALLLIDETHDSKLLHLFAEKVSAINNNDDERAFLDILVLFLSRYEADTPPIVRVLVDSAVALWRKAINKYSVSSKTSSLPPSLDKIRGSLKNETSEQADGWKNGYFQGGSTPTE